VQVELERVAELVLLRLVGALVAGPLAVQLVLPHVLLGELGEEVAQRIGADRPQAARRELEPAFLLLDQPGLLEHLRQLTQPFELLRGVVAEEVAHAVHVGFGEGPGVGGVLQEMLELVEVAELLHGLHRLGEPHRVLALEVVLLAPVHLREHLLQVGAELIELPAQVHVAEQLIAELLHLGPLLGRHRVEHRLHRRHATGHLLEQLLQRLRVLREEVAELLHELLEPGVLATLLPVEHLVEGGEHVLHALHVARGHVLHALGHLVDHLLHELLAQPVEHLLETLLGLARLEVVGAQFAHLAGQVVRHEIESHVALGGHLAGGVGAPLVTTRLRIAHGVLDRVSLLVDDVVELARDLVVDTAEIVTVEPLLTFLPELGEQVAQALQPLAVGAPHTVLHHPTQGGVDVAVIQQLVGELAEQGVGVEIEAALGAVPP
jgi:hypothetical protein